MHFKGRDFSPPERGKPLAEHLAVLREASALQGGEMKSACWIIPPDLTTRAFFWATWRGLVRLTSPRRSRSEHLAQLFEAGVLKWRTTLRTTSNYLKIRRLEEVLGCEIGQLVSKSAIAAPNGVGIRDFQKIRRRDAINRSLRAGRSNAGQFHHVMGSSRRRFLGTRGWERRCCAHRRGGPSGDP